MLLSESFKAASEATESWVRLITDARHLAEQGEMRAAYGILLGLSVENEDYDSVLRDAREKIESVSDGVIRHDGLVGPRSYASAHEAISEIKKLILLAFQTPLQNINDPIRRNQMLSQLFRERGRTDPLA